MRVLKEILHPDAKIRHSNTRQNLSLKRILLPLQTFYALTWWFNPDKFVFDVVLSSIFVVKELVNAKNLTE